LLERNKEIILKKEKDIEDKALLFDEILTSKQHIEDIFE